MAARRVPTRFAVAFSMAGKQRELVLPIAQETEAELGRSTVFYDTWYEDWIADSDLDVLLRHIYGERAELVVICISATYAHSAWSLAEHRAICTRIFSLTPSPHLGILPLRVGDGEVRGISTGGVVPDIRRLTARESAGLVIDRLNLLRRSTTDGPSIPDDVAHVSLSSIRMDPDGRSPEESMSGTVFISYRRSDQPAFAGRLYDRLVDRFGDDQVFMDVDSIEPGVDFVDVLTQRLEQCAALIAVIGRDWLAATDAMGGRRLDDPGDFVRLEIEHALTRGIRLIPVLVDGAKMPRQPDLPKSMALLARRNGYPMSNSHFRLDAEELLTALERVLR